MTKVKNGRVVTPRMEREAQVGVLLSSALQRIEVLERFVSGLAGSLLKSGVAMETIQEAFAEEGLSFEKPEPAAE